MHNSAGILCCFIVHLFQKSEAPKCVFTFSMLLWWHVCTHILYFVASNFTGWPNGYSLRLRPTTSIYPLCGLFLQLFCTWVGYPIWWPGLFLNDVHAIFILNFLMYLYLYDVASVQTHKIKKFVLHTNYPGHADFNSYIKCNFVVYGSDCTYFFFPSNSEALGCWK